MEPFRAWYTGKVTSVDGGDNGDGSNPTDPLTCKEGEELVEGVCKPITLPPEPEPKVYSCEQGDSWSYTSLDSGEVTENTMCRHELYRQFTYTTFNLASISKCSKTSATNTDIMKLGAGVSKDSTVTYTKYYNSSCRADITTGGVSTTYQLTEVAKPVDVRAKLVTP